MTKVSREELLKIGHMARIEILKEEIPTLIEQIEGLLSYAERISQVAADVIPEETKNSNIFADDVIDKTDSASLLDRAPDREENYFVVPKILET